jgi:multiple sugar transport system ATP-binding protein
MNFIPTRVVEATGGGHGAEIRHGDNTWVFRLPKLAGLADYVGKEVILGIRPEALSASGDGQSGYPCKVDIVEPTGPDTQVFINLNGKSVVCRVAPRAAKEPGQVLNVAVDLDQVVLFDPATQNRIR